MFLIIGLLLIVLWLGGFLLHVAGGLIHILLVLAVISGIIHLVTGTKKM
jgi:hypothetical protein